MSLRSAILPILAVRLGEPQGPAEDDPSKSMIGLTKHPLATPLLVFLAACGGARPVTGPPAQALPSPAPAYLDGLGSVLPNMGVGLGLGRVLRRSDAATTFVEAQAIYQFLDDEDVASDGQPKAGPWYQIMAGLKRSSTPAGLRHVTSRIGAVWLRAEGEPNFIQEEGNYLGAYGGVGFETHLGPSLMVGPNVTILLITRDVHFSLARPVPQISWHASLGLGGGRDPGSSRRPPVGELYLGGSGLVSPGLGGGVELGQVFRRGERTTWSVELHAGFQAPRDAVLFEGDGVWAQARVGTKTSIAREGRGQWTVRGGAVWFRTSAPTPLLERIGDFVGGYAGAGYEIEAGRLTTGPELSFMIVTEEKGVRTFNVVPQLVWHATVGL